MTNETRAAEKVEAFAVYLEWLAASISGKVLPVEAKQFDEVHRNGWRTQPKDRSCPKRLLVCYLLGLEMVTRCGGTTPNTRLAAHAPGQAA